MRVSLVRSILGLAVLFTTLTTLTLSGQGEEKTRETAVASPGTARFKVKAIKDIAYYDGPDAHATKHKLDLFLPQGVKNFPVLFFVHGGAWRRGDKSFLGVYSGLGHFYASRGIGAVITNYRLSPAVKHPEHIKDVARAFAWTYNNIARRGGDPREIFVCGHSAGGHLVALLATDEQYLKKFKLSARQIRGVIPISGVYRIPDHFLRSVFGTDEKVVRLASPIAHVHKELPPFLILYADHDLPACGKEPSEAFARALKAKGNEVQTREITDSNHFFTLVHAGIPDTVASRAVLEFITRHARK
jgi:acetyl esterase/lipase